MGSLITKAYQEESTKTPTSGGSRDKLQVQDGSHVHGHEDAGPDKEGGP